MRTVWRRGDAPDDGVDLAAALAEVEERLVSLAPGAIRAAAARASGPFWCCALVFDSSVRGCVPPELAPITVAERDAATARGGSASRALVWRAIAFDAVGRAYFDDAELETACARARASMPKAQARRMRELYVRVARRLNDVPIEDYGPVSREFVVYAYDRDDSPRALVARSLGAAQRRRLEEIGIL